MNDLRVAPPGGQNRHDGLVALEDVGGDLLLREFLVLLLEALVGGEPRTAVAGGVGQGHAALELLGEEVGGVDPGGLVRVHGNDLRGINNGCVGW